MTTVLLLLAACGGDPPAPKVEEPAAPPPKAEAEVEEPEEPARPTTRNKPPVVREATIETHTPRENDDIVAKVEASDPEGNHVDETYTWLRNGEEVLGFHDNRLSAGNYKRGDEIACSVSLSDGELTTVVQLGTVKVVNTNPVIENPPGRVNRLEGLQLRASDEDGDTITWKLEGAPDGLSIDAGGMLHYRASQAAAGGDFTVKIIADDGNGGWARVDLPIKVSAGSDAPKPSGG